MVKSALIVPNPKQERFCREFMIDHNGTQAMIRAGYSKKTATAQASMMLAKPHIQKFLAELAKSQAMDLTVTADRVIKELARLAFHDVGAYYKRDKNQKLVLRDLDELTYDQRAAVAEYDPEKKILKLYSKDPSLDKLGKHLKLFTELHEQQHNFTIMPELKLNGNVVIFNVGLPKGKK